MQREQVVDFIKDSLESSLPEGHYVDVIEGGLIHICGKEHHYTIDLIDVADEKEDQMLELVHAEVLAALVDRFPDHEVTASGDKIFVNGEIFNFSLGIDEVEVLERLEIYSEEKENSEEFDFSEVEEI
ncbi:MAG TPA: hypothetical protein PLP33_14860 [Leptospiraceae bacterium]|nr:hypothetical protein [Leptospiraceae bacterium]